MPIPAKEIEDLFNFYLLHGFDCSTDEIVEALNISRKTFFNRYKSKDNAMKMAIEFWYETFQCRFQEKIALCNHAVEELIQYGYELQYVRSNERYYYQYLVDNNLFTAEDSPFVTTLEKIIQKGIQHYQFKEDVNEKLYARYALNNIVHYNYMKNETGEVIQFLLSPIVTDRTKALLKELDLDSF